MLEAVLFDIDGVLVDSEPLYYRAMRDTFRHFGIEMGTDEYVIRFMIEQTTSPGIIRDYGLTAGLDEIKKIRKQLVLEYFKELEPMPYARRLVESLKGNYQLGVVSGSSRFEIDLKLNVFDPNHPFKIMVGEEDAKRRKPHPDPYLKGVEMLGFKAENVVVVEDNPSGVISAKDAGCKVIAFPNGLTRDVNRFDFSRADRIVYSLYDINREFLDKMF